jgi:hypothetical protein
MEDRVKQAGAYGLPLSELTKAFQHELRALRQQRLQTLLGSESVLADLPSGLYTAASLKNIA